MPYELNFGEIYWPSIADHSQRVIGAEERELLVSLNSLDSAPNRENDYRGQNAAPHF